MTRTDNDFFMSSDGRSLRPLLPVNITTREQAYRTAAWIKAMAATLPLEGDGDTFDAIEEAIRNT